MFERINDNNKHLGNEKKHFGPTLRWMICTTLDCVRLTQSSVIQIIFYNVGLECFFIYQNDCLLSSLYMYISPTPCPKISNTPSFNHT